MDVAVKMFTGLCGNPKKKLLGSHETEAAMAVTCTEPRRENAQKSTPRSQQQLLNRKAKHMLSSSLYIPHYRKRSSLLAQESSRLTDFLPTSHSQVKTRNSHSWKVAGPQS